METSVDQLLQLIGSLTVQKNLLEQRVAQLEQSLSSVASRPVEEDAGID